MKKIVSINISQPCHVEWQQMTRVEQGRHCQSCCKTVIDFTAMSNIDIIAYFTLHENICGRIASNQLTAINYKLEFQNKNQFS
jgi:hypothetical protein